MAAGASGSASKPSKKHVDVFIDEQGVQQLAEQTSLQAIENIQLVFCSSMNNRGVLSLMNTQWFQTALNER